jgi:uncharacterized membrane protein YgcG
MHRPSRRSSRLRRTLRPAVGVGLALEFALFLAGAASAAGPPFPDPVVDQAVYDTADVFRPETVATAEARIDAIEARTGAELVVYTQMVPYSITTEEAEAHAVALIDQWGVGRQGFDDGMVILFDLDPSLCHGQVQLYAAPGFETTYLSNEQRQAIFDDDMLPYLRGCSLDEALLVALEKIDRAATPENAAALQAGRQVNAVLGLIAAPAALLGLAGFAVVSWRRHGRDPVYLDSPSIHVPAPPPGLSAAAAALLVQGRAKRRALTTALLDLASRGELAFREESGPLGFGRKVGIDVRPDASPDPVTEAHRQRNGRRPLGPAEDAVVRRLRALPQAHDGYLAPDEVLKFGAYADAFDTSIEKYVTEQGWMPEPASKVVARWALRGGAAFVGGIVVLIAGSETPASGLVMVGLGLAAGGIILALFAPSMPRVTKEGAVARAQLAAYRRTLEKTMAQARSMQQVVDEAGLDWLDTPDQAVVWGVALGLEDEVEAVLERTLHDVRDGAAPPETYTPSWYRGSGGGGWGSGSGGSGGSLLSSSPVPNLGGMFATLGTIGNAPSSSGSGGGGGGFSGGSSGGGGGGAGGGF